MRECVLSGLPLNDILIIDEHCHMGPVGGTFTRGASAEDLLADMDSLGIDKSVVSHSMSLVSDFSQGNDLIIETVKKYPDRFIGYCTINPLYPDEILPELERCFTHEGMVGVKLHPWCHERSLSYKHYRSVYEFANERRLPVMSHTYTGEDVATTGLLAEEFPEAVFIMAHMGGEGVNVEYALEMAAGHENVYGDIAVSQSMEGRIEYFVNEITSKKFLFGTDNACMNPVATMAMIAMAEISDEEKKDIFGLNMQRILSRRKY